MKHATRQQKRDQTFLVSKVVSYRQCLELHCISNRIETLKNTAANTLPAQSKDLVPKNDIQSSKTSHFWKNSTIFKMDFPSSRSICLTPAIIFETVWNTMLLHAQLIVSELKKMSSL